MFGGKGQADAGCETVFVPEIFKTTGVTHANHQDTPPMDVSIVVAGLLARGSLLLSRLPDAFSSISGIFRQRLTTYSCGGSSSIGASKRSTRLTEFPLSSRLRFEKTTTILFSNQLLAGVNIKGFKFMKRG